MHNPVIEALDATTEALEANNSSNWIVGFSGGKDSTALLKIFHSAYKRANQKPNNIDVIYCDTGVENILLDDYIKRLFRRLRSEAREKQLPFRYVLLKAPVHERYFVKVIGRGYPTPTNNFRWCTKNMRIKPVENFISRMSAKSDAIVSLGLRVDESEQRKRSINRSGGGMWQEQIEGKRNSRLFLPIINCTVPDVWDIVYMFSSPKSIRPEELEIMYRNASGECPIIKAPTSPPCGAGRFGCWTCTVVRKDHSAIKLIDAGYSELQPFLDFRNWLSEIRNDPFRRWPERRNGSEGLGPFTLAARKEILFRLAKLQVSTQRQLISNSELSAIYSYWDEDRGEEPL